MKIGMTSLTFRNESIETVVENAKLAGISGIEWGVSDSHMPLCDKESAEKIKKLSRENNIEIFSLGSYCKMTDKEECDKALKTAIILDAPVIRVWAGEKMPEECDESYLKLIVGNTACMAEKAKEIGIKIGFEFHENTLTQDPDSAINLIKLINMDNVGLYWQPLNLYTPEENAEIFKKVRPYLVGNLHIHNYNNGYLPLSDIEERLSIYYEDIKNEKFNLMIEFVKDASLESLIADVNTLKKALL